MLDIVLHNVRQHRQFQHRNGPLLLARVGSDHPVWLPVEQCRAQAAEAVLEIVPDGEGIALAMAGCEAECFRGRPRGLTGQCRLPVPASFAIGDTRFEIVDANAGALLTSRSLERLLKDRTNSTLKQPPTELGPATSTISRWFTAIGSLRSWRSSLQELYTQAARCAVESIGLDGAVVLRRRDGHWEIAASHLPHPELGIHCEMRVLDELLRSPETMFHGRQWASRQIGLLDRTAIASSAVVVSPLRNAAGEFVGAIYGYRSVRTGNARRGIRYLEAHMIELLASAVSESIAQLERETEVDRRRVLLKRALAATLNHDGQKLLSETREATLLFADLRKSTELAASLQIEQQYELLGHVMDCLTAAVMEHDGMVIDYYGDGLSAMWNAPADQAEHAELACRAALRMLERLPDVAADWSAILATDLRIAVGIHTGMVQVGNAGSTKRMKYGPRGPNVHVASRVEAAAKEINVSLIATRPVVERLSNRFIANRICRARLRGVEEPVDMFSIEFAASDADCPSTPWKRYAAALIKFEAGDLAEAAELLQASESFPRNVPARFLAEHVQREINRRRQRRSADKDERCHRGVITLGAK